MTKTLLSTRWFRVLWWIPEKDERMHAHPRSSLSLVVWGEYVERVGEIGSHDWIHDVHSRLVRLVSRLGWGDAHQVTRTAPGTRVLVFCGRCHSARREFVVDSTRYQPDRHLQNLPVRLRRWVVE